MNDVQASNLTLVNRALFNRKPQACASCGEAVHVYGLRSNAKSWQQVLVVCLVSLAAMKTADAHPFHSALAEVELNEESNSLEVALRIDAIDFEQALRKQTNKPVDLDKTKQAEPIVRSYVSKHFQLKSASGKALPQKWVGWELEGRNAWLYFEVPVNAPPQKVQVRFAILLDHAHRQVNMLALTQDGKRRTIVFHGDKATQWVNFE